MGYSKPVTPLTSRAPVHVLEAILKAITIDLPFLYDAEIVTNSGIRRTRRRGRFQELVPVEVGEACPDDFNLVLHATGVRFIPNYGAIEGCGEDRIFERGGFPYRQLWSQGRPLELDRFVDDLAVGPYSEWSGQVGHIPPPPYSVCGAYGARAVEFKSTLEQLWKRKGWTDVRTLSSNHSDRWSEAHAHYQGAVLNVQGTVWVRCGEPAWYVFLPPQALYQRHRNSLFASSEFPIDDREGIEDFMARIGRRVAHPVAYSTTPDLDTWSRDTVDFFVALGHFALDQAESLKSRSTREQRRREGCDGIVDRLIEIKDRPGPLKAFDVAGIIDDLTEAVKRLGGVIQGPAAGIVESNARLLRARLEVEGARAPIPSTADDLAALEDYTLVGMRADCALCRGVRRRYRSWDGCVHSVLSGGFRIVSSSDACQKLVDCRRRRPLSNLEHPYAPKYRADRRRKIRPTSEIA